MSDSLHTIVETIEKDGPNIFSRRFEPHCGDKYAQAKVKFMVCGKATAGSLERTPNDWKTQAVWEGSKFIDHLTGPGRYSSAFWRFVFDLGGKLTGRSSRDDIFDRIAWTNVAKIGTVEGNPSESHLNAFRQDFVKALHEELDRWNPDVVVFVTNWYGLDIWWEALKLWQGVCPYEFMEDVEVGGIKMRPKPGTTHPHVWVLRHPQGWKLEHRNRAVECIINRQAERGSP